jgi:hypothetical protein
VRVERAAREVEAVEEAPDHAVVPLDHLFGTPYLRTALSHGVSNLSGTPTPKPHSDQPGALFFLGRADHQSPAAGAAAPAARALRRARERERIGRAGARGAHRFYTRRGRDVST